MSMFEFPGTLTRELSVRVVNVSASGCLFESRRRIEVGTIATLQLGLGGAECSDDVEVVRCEAVKGVPGLYQIGVRLLWTTPRHAGSIRHAVATRLAALDRADADYVS
jgi:hypothetical protein